MSLDDLGNLGDFLGGLAVIVSFVYLGLQIRQNTASIRATIPSPKRPLAPGAMRTQIG